MPENYCIALRWALQLVQKLDVKTISSAITDVFRIIVKATRIADKALELAFITLDRVSRQPGSTVWRYGY